MSIQLVCINYVCLQDATRVVRHCIDTFKRLDKVTVLHPDVDGINIHAGGDPSIHVRKAHSPTQNECCLYEMPQYITCDHALGIQWDGYIINPESWTDEFLEYDLVAPPWTLENIVNPEWRVGSGGFCLFSKRFAQAWGSICKPHPAPNTDWVYGALERDKFEALGMKFAPVELAMRFGEEMPLEDKPRVEKPFGFHGFQYGNHDKYRKMVYG